LWRFLAGRLAASQLAGFGRRRNSGAVRHEGGVVSALSAKTVGPPTRADWLLLFLSRGPLGAAGPVELDPIRIQKGLFLLSKRGPARDLYSFRPHYWGPFSSEIYRDLSGLEAQGLVQTERPAGQTWSLYRTSAQGEARAAEVAELLEPRVVQWLADDRGFVSKRSFVRLLKEIYAAYPEYAEKSLLIK
jgi:DNA-binding PadR family transcriptional regulator